MLGLLCTFALAAPQRRPHVLLILADDLGAADVGYVDSRIKTPALDALANSGIKFRAHYTWNWCAPSRGAILTGLYPPMNGYAQNASGGPRP